LEREQQTEEEDENYDENHGETDENRSSDEGSDEDDMYFSAEEDTEDGQDPRAKVLTVQELENMFMYMAPPLSG